MAFAGGKAWDSHHQRGLRWFCRVSAGKVKCSIHCLRLEVESLAESAEGKDQETTTMTCFFFWFFVYLFKVIYFYFWPFLRAFWGFLFLSRFLSLR